MVIKTKFDVGDTVFVEKEGQILSANVSEIQLLITENISESYLFFSLGGIVREETKVFATQEEATDYLRSISK